MRDFHQTCQLKKKQASFLLALALLGALAGALRAGEPAESPEAAPTHSQIRATLLGWDAEVARVLPAVQGRKTSEALREALALGRSCRWDDCSKRIRVLCGTQEKELRGEAGFFKALLIAVELGALCDRKEIEGIFSAAKAEFEPERGGLLLQYADATSRAWELEGDRAEGSGTIELGEGRTLSIQVPFLRVNALERLWNQPQAAGCSFQGRIAGLDPDCSLEVSWRNFDGKGDRREKKDRLAAVSCRWASDAAGGGWIFTELLVGETVKPYSKRQLVKMFFQEWRTLSSELGEAGAVFSVDRGIKQSVPVRGPEIFHLSLRGKGQAVSLDWVRISGAVDGLWLARQLFLRLKDRPEAFLKTWKDPFAQS